MTKATTRATRALSTSFTRGQLDEIAAVIRDQNNLLRSIQHQLDNRVWTPDTLERIAELMRGQGYEIRDVEE